MRERCRGVAEDAGGRWVEEPILPELPPPPPNLVRVRGAQLIRVTAFDPAGNRRGFTEAVVLAWAPLRGGGWGVLTAWLSGWQSAGRTTGRGRWAWCRLPDDLSLVTPMPPPRHLLEDDEWHGHHPDHGITIAMRQAALTLPEPLRDAALAPAGPRTARP